MSRQDANAAFARTSFLYGTNAAYIEDLYARYEKDPAAVDAEWQAFFQGLKDDKADVEKSAQGASWKLPNWPPRANGDLVAALDGNWAETEKAIGDKIKAKAQGAGVEVSTAGVTQATRDSIHALMLIRAYRIRGHFHANLDPLGIQVEPPDEAELDPKSYGFTEADLDRKIFLDMVLGLEFASMREIVAILRRTYCQTLGVEFMHISNAAQKGWIQERIEGRDKEISFTREGKRAILNKLVEAEGFEKFLDVKYTGTKRFGLDGGESLIPALEQIIKRGGNLGVAGDRARHAAPRPPQCLDPGDGQAAPRAVPRIQGRLVDAGRDRRLRRREISSRRLVRPRVRRQPGAPVAHRQSVASGNRRSGDARQIARQAGSAQRHAGRPHHGAAAADARRRRVCRSGRGGGMFRALRSERLPHRRLACTSSSTTRSASPPIRAIRAPRPIHPTSPR